MRLPTRSLCLLAALASLAVAACAREPGPAERAGASIDHATQNLRDAVDPPKGPAESAGRSIDRAVGQGD